VAALGAPPLFSDTRSYSRDSTSSWRQHPQRSEDVNTTGERHTSERDARHHGNRLAPASLHPLARPGR
jgi:hypothetical protein